MFPSIAQELYSVLFEILTIRTYITYILLEKIRHAYHTN